MATTAAREAESPLHLPTYDDVLAAAERLKGAANRTPVLTSRTANRLTGAELFFKCENLQRVGAFKFRGAYNAISALSPEQKRAGVVTFSSGNHAQAIALAGRLLGVPTTIVMPQDAPAMKVRATREYGGDIVIYDRYKDSRVEVGARLARERGLTLIPPYDHPDVIAGQGTAVKELAEEVGTLDLLLVCLGGGGLLAGSALSAASLLPGCKVVGVEPEAGNDGQQSFRAGHVVEIPVPKTIADGAQTTYIGAYNFPIIQRHVADIVTVSDAELVETMSFLAERMKLMVEPTGCLAAAAALKGHVPVKGKRVGIILSGGNVDLKAFAGFVGTA